MANIITFLNVKGGVGKTTICFNLAHALKIVGDKKVLLVDMDHQENLSGRAIKNRQEKKNSAYDLISDENVDAINCIYDSRVPNTKVIPGDIELQRAIKDLDPSMNPAIMNTLKEKLKPIEDSYDYILIDTHPTLDILSTMSLLASNYYCVPVKPEPDSLVGISITDSYLKNARKANPGLKDLGILMTDYDKRTNIAHEVLNTLKQRFGNRIMDSVIGRNVAITNAAMKAQTIFQYDPRQNGCKYFRELAEEIINKCEDSNLSEEG